LPVIHLDSPEVDKDATARQIARERGITFRRQVINGPAASQQSKPGFLDERDAATVRPCQLYESHLPVQFHQRDTLDAV
jgi:hypothetical protein